MSSISPTNQELSNDTTFSQIKSHVPVPLKVEKTRIPEQQLLRTKRWHPYNIRTTVAKETGFLIIKSRPAVASLENQNNSYLLT